MAVCEGGAERGGLMSEVSHQKVWSQHAKPLLSYWVGHVIRSK